jgi:heme O synthase-like polyprenyltransferase
MKTAALEAQNTNLASTRGRLGSDFAELVKARLTLLVLLTTAVGFYLGAELPIDYVGLFHVVLGTAAAAAGAAALNQWWERRLDVLMHRTRTRPIPAGRMRPLEGLVLGVVLSIFGIGYLAIACNMLSAVLAAITIAIYIFAYTPLKRTSTANTAVGAIPGAIPPMVGWAAARRCRCMEPFCHSRFVATAPFLRHRLDVSRRLFARRLPNDFQRRSQRRTKRQSKRVLLHLVAHRRRVTRFSRSRDDVLCSD